MTAPPRAPRSTRRDVLVTAAGAFAGVGALAAAWPLVSSLAPNPGSPGPNTTSVDLAGIGVGVTRQVPWQSYPILIRHRPAEEIARARGKPIAQLFDPSARNPRLDAKAPATDDNRAAPGLPQWLVVIGVCTRETCLLVEATGADRIDDGLGWRCPCCAAGYDFAGRLVRGPAARNLDVPRYSIDGLRLTVG